MISIDSRLFVEIVPFEGPGAPVPHPINHGRFDIERIYKVLGVYSPSETSEGYFILSNPKREIWFISNRHCRAYGLFDSDLLSLPKREAAVDVSHPSVIAPVPSLLNGATRAASVPQ